jgi:hypothetical protein
MLMSGHDLSPRAAAAELERTAALVRRRAHWPAWMFLALAGVNFAFFVVVGSGNRALADALIPLPTLLAVGVFLVAARQPVIGQDAQRINKPVALAGLVTVAAGLLVDQTVLPRRFTWWLALLAALMVAPYLVGAWRWLRR